VPYSSCFRLFGSEMKWRSVLSGETTRFDWRPIHMDNMSQRPILHVPLRKQPADARWMSRWVWGITLGIAALIAVLGVIFLSIVK
jgi:hypothetical protein